MNGVSMAFLITPRNNRIYGNNLASARTRISDQGCCSDHFANCATTTVRLALKSRICFEVEPAMFSTALEKTSIYISASFFALIRMTDAARERFICLLNLRRVCRRLFSNFFAAACWLSKTEVSRKNCKIFFFSKSTTWSSFTSRKVFHQGIGKLLN